MHLTGCARDGRGAERERALGRAICMKRIALAAVLLAYPVASVAGPIEDKALVCAACHGSDLLLSARRKSFLRAQFDKHEASAPAFPSRGPGNGILRAETGGRFQAQNAGERSEFGSQTATSLTNPPELRGFLSTRKPPQFVGTAWWRTQSRQTGLRDRARLGNREKHTAMAHNAFFWSGLGPVPYSKEGQNREFDQQVTRKSCLSL